MSPEDREALALRYHREVRKQDQENALMCHPLLSLPENCQPFPSLDQFENTSQELTLIMTSRTPLSATFTIKEKPANPHMVHQYPDLTPTPSA